MHAWPWQLVNGAADLPVAWSDNAERDAEHVRVRLTNHESHGLLLSRVLLDCLRPGRMVGIGVISLRAIGAGADGIVPVVDQAALQACRLVTIVLKDADTARLVAAPVRPLKS